MRDDIKLWRDSKLHGGMEILRASCYQHSYRRISANEYADRCFFTRRH